VPLSVLPARLPEVPKDRPVYVICQTGGRSARAAALMRSVGVDATDVAGGTGAWIASGRPVESA
jgi:rhodanese-related sulfurtransferase